MSKNAKALWLILRDVFDRRSGGDIYMPRKNMAGGERRDTLRHEHAKRASVEEFRREQRSAAQRSAA